MSESSSCYLNCVYNLRALMASSRSAEQLDGIDINSLQSRDDLAKFEVIRKSTLMKQQHALRGAESIGEAVGGFTPISWVK
ncbi:AMP-binding protein [Oligella ureolytica]